MFVACENDKSGGILDMLLNSLYSVVPFQGYSVLRKVFFCIGDFHII
jgi:hypothetical protein